MKVYIAVLESTAPYSQSKHHQEPKLDRENAQDYEARTWRSRMHVNDKGEVFIPPMAFKNCLSDAAKFVSIQIPGKGKSTYTKHFEAGLMVLDEVSLGVKINKVEGEWVFVPSDGRRGGTTRVAKCFGKIPSWKASVKIHVIDETITKDVLQKHFEAAGELVGIGRWRPRNNGLYGRFKVLSLKEA